MNRIRESWDKFDATVQFKFLCNSFFLVRPNSIVVEGGPLSRRFRSECKFQKIRVFQTTSDRVPALCCENVPNPLLGVEISQDVQVPART